MFLGSMGFMIAAAAGFAAGRWFTALDVTSAASSDGSQQCSDPATVAETVHAATDGVAAVGDRPSIPIPDPVGLVEAAVQQAAGSRAKDARPGWKVVAEEFNTWKKIAADRGMSVPKDYRLPAELYDAFAAAYEHYEHSVRTTDAVRLPMIQAIAERKIAVGAYEQFASPESLEGAPASDARKQLREARAPRVLGQTVVMSGDAGTIRLIRVDLADDPALATLHGAIERARTEFYEAVAVLIGPLPR